MKQDSRQHQNDSAAFGATIIVCTYNGKRRLETTLRRVWEQSCLPSGKIQVILVDNRSTDGTSEFAASLHQNIAPQHHLQILYEPNPGKTNAMLTGFKHATAECVIICDDDNWLHRDYCRNALEVLNCHPDVGIAGGTSIAAPEATPPQWFSNIAAGWAVGVAEKTGYRTDPDPCIWGAGMVVRKSAFDQLMESGFKFLCMARTGKALTSGEDSELCRAMTTLGWKIYEDQRLQIHHFIERHRLSTSYTYRLWSGFGAGDIAVDADRLARRKDAPLRNWLSLCWPYQVGRAVLWLTIHCFDAPILNPKNPQNSLRWCKMKGRLLAIWKLKSAYRQVIGEKIDWIRRNTKGS